MRNMVNVDWRVIKELINELAIVPRVFLIREDAL